MYKAGAKLKNVESGALGRKMVEMVDGFELGVL